MKLFGETGEKTIRENHDKGVFYLIRRVMHLVLPLSLAKPMRLYHE